MSGGARVASERMGFDGTGYVTQLTNTGARVVFAVNVPKSGTYQVSLRYASSDAGSLKVAVNGYAEPALGLPASSAFSSKTSAVELRAGLNTLSYLKDAGNIEIDSLVIADAAALAPRGATLPYVEHEAEAAKFTGSVIGKPSDREFLTKQAEASGRQYVELDAMGEDVSFTLTAPASALVVRFSIPDSQDGKGTQASIGLYAGETKLKDIPLDSKYAWVYGGYPYNNNPGDGKAHRFFDEQRVVIPEQPAGTVLTLRKDAQSTAPSYLIDLVDFELVPPALTIKPDFVSIAAHGAIPDDGKDDTAAINAAIAAAQSAKKGVFIPSGTFEIASLVHFNGITLAGAGPWYSVLHGKDGHGGLFGDGGSMSVLDLAIYGDVSYRNDADFHTALEGQFGEGSLIQNLWIEHAKTGIWLSDGAKGTYVVGLRIRDTFADGVNVRNGVENVRVDQSHVRNTGDDALAMWSEVQPDKNCAFTFNTIQLPMLANGIGMYCGMDNRAEDNLISDTVTESAGIAVSTRFYKNVPFSGTQTIARNTLTRTGGYLSGWGAEVGGLWLFMDPRPEQNPENPIDIGTPIVVKDVDIIDSSYQGILFSYNRTITNVSFERVKIQGATGHGIDIQVKGSGSFNSVTVSDTKKAALNNPNAFGITGSGNTGLQ